VRRKALRIRHMHGMEVREKRPRGIKKEAQGVQVSPRTPRSVSPWPERREGEGGREQREVAVLDDHLVLRGAPRKTTP
jgi:hypothetical protein